MASMDNPFTSYSNIPDDDSAIIIEEDQLAGKYPNGRNFDWEYPGYIFDHWSTVRDDGAEYFYPGETLGADSPIILYAIWRAVRTFIARE